tara:strand:- start:1162 stop:1791 length:630 start_codon:yes stop_codon:yes gene_type:complete
METPRTKYPRSFHLPWSLGATDDDKTLGSVEHFVGRQVVVTVKMDGENTTIYSDGYLHARSTSGRSHTSQAWCRALAARLANDIPEGWRVCGENLYAQHSIRYEALTSYFNVFSIWDGTRCLPWDETVQWAEMMDLTTVPVLYVGEWNEEAIRALSSVVTEGQEGYVVRLADGFDYADFSGSLAKFVRANHVTTDKHWKAQAIVPNKLA